MKPIIFEINDQQYFQINNLCSEKNHLYRYDDASISFFDNGREYELGQKLLIIIVELLYVAVNGTLNNEFEINVTAIRSERNYDYIEVIEMTDKQTKHWKGKGQLISFSELFSAYMYNIKRKIYLEIVPTYKSNDLELNESIEASPSDELFIANYKPYVIFEIDVLIAFNWLKQLKKLMHEIEDNDQYYLR